ncbi:MAG: ImmA/IrrE family metallo-endopeptidase [Gemmatimonadetes bacterium]|nr:ImmA/IrrE family metallo-endopeptidase [Gemmatimonadota bacterium]
MPARVPWPQQGFLRRWEGKAQELRRILGLGDEDSLDPLELIEKMPGVLVASVVEIGNGTGSLLDCLRRARNSWWAAAYRETGGPWLIVYNPWQSDTRLRSSLMEEVAHIHLNHKPTRVFPDPATGLLTRDYGISKEKEAYGVAAAALVPFVGLVRQLARGEPDASIARHYGVSPALLRYRTNTTRARHRAAHTPARS